MNPFYQAKIVLLGTFNDRVSQAHPFNQMSFYFKVINVLVVYSCPQLHEKSLFLKLLPFTPSFSARGSMTGNSRLHEIVFYSACPVIFARP